MTTPVQTRLRTAGIRIQGKAILLESQVGRAVWGIPGGSLEANETVEQGCIRKYAEETGIEMNVIGMALINENIYRLDGKLVREYCFYCLVQPVLPALRASLSVQSREAEIEFAWFPIAEVPRLTFGPTFLAPLLPYLSSATRFLSTVE